MEHEYFRDISNFFVAGINYKKSDASTRGEYAINSEQYEQILQYAHSIGVRELFILSTCNRTEIYGFAGNVHQLIHLLCSQTSGSEEHFIKSAYIKSGWDAVKHVFHVGAGLDSQILGDYEIVGQLKTAVKFSKNHGGIGAFTERMINSVLQSSKSIKNTTALSGGTVSVSFAAVQYINKNVVDLPGKKILLIGTGKIGKNTCRNLVDYTGSKNITLLNRTVEKARELAEEMNLQFAGAEDFEKEVGQADIILVATHAPEPLISKQHIRDGEEKLIIDLSIPHNVDPSVHELSHVHLVNVDELSKMKDETLRRREAEVPKAKAIIKSSMEEFQDWYEMRKHVPMLKQLKLKLKLLHTHPQYTTTTCTKKIDTHIQRVLNETAGKMRAENQRGCHYISALHQFISSRN